MSETVIQRRMVDGTAVTANCRLVVIESPGPKAEVMLTPGLAVRVGQGADCDLIVKDEGVSRHHLTLTTRRDGFFLEDRGSTNGTFVGGVQVERAVLAPGSVLRLGASVLRILPPGKLKRLHPSPRTRFGRLIGESKAMREVFSLLERVSPTEVTTLVRGETGTGKELAARSLHELSLRADKPFVVFDCAGVTPSLIESELYGHKKGAFTGATADMPGVFERARGGTVFIDEVGELPLEQQPRLLRVLDSRTVRRLGSTQDLSVDVRVIAATHRDLVKMVQAGSFREDLYFRLSVVEIKLPPLLGRLEDLVPLVRHFLVARGWDPGLEVAGANLQILQRHKWPGNVRELRNVLDRAISLSGAPGKPFEELIIELGELQAEPTLSQANLGLPFKQAKAAALERFEASYLEALIKHCKGNLSRAARSAELDRGHLRTLLRKHELIGDRDE